MFDIADYCRQVEAHLTRVNGGHLVRVVGAGFALVKGWADDGVPLSIVFRAIEQKAERHKAGRSQRPLRIEFCEADVRDLHAAWRRAVGLTGESRGEQPDASPDRSNVSKRRSVSKTIDRAIERLGRLAGRLDYPETFRDVVSKAIEALQAVRDELARTRGPARVHVLERLVPLDRELLAQARLVVAPDVLRGLTTGAEAELAPYRDRLTSEKWTHAVSVTLDRAVQEHLGMPSLEF